MFKTSHFIGLFRFSRSSVGTCNNARVGLSPKHGISCQKERHSFRFRISMTGRTAANRSRTVKTWVERLSVWSISPPRRPFFRGKNRIAFRKEMSRLPQRRNLFAARHSLRVQKEGKNKASEGFSRSGWSPAACKPRLPFCKPFLRGADARADSGRTAFRGGQQNVANTSFRLSSCIPLGAYGSRIPVLFPSRARLHGSRRCRLDVLTDCHWGTCCCPPAFWRLRDKRRQEAAGATETGKEVPEGRLFFLPGIVEIYGCPHRISTAPLFHLPSPAWRPTILKGERHGAPHHRYSAPPRPFAARLPPASFHREFHHVVHALRHFTQLQHDAVIRLTEVHLLA